MKVRMKLKDKILSTISPTYKKVYYMQKNLNKLCDEKGMYLMSISEEGDFKKYLISNNMPEKIQKLKEGLDEESIDIINNKIQHILQMPTGRSVIGRAYTFQTLLLFLMNAFIKHKETYQKQCSVYEYNIKVISLIFIQRYFIIIMG